MAAVEMATEATNRVARADAVRAENPSFQSMGVAETATIGEVAAAAADATLDTKMAAAIVAEGQAELSRAGNNQRRQPFVPINRSRGSSMGSSTKGGDSRDNGRSNNGRTVDTNGSKGHNKGRRTNRGNRGHNKG